MVDSNRSVRFGQKPPTTPQTTHSRRAVDAVERGLHAQLRSLPAPEQLASIELVPEASGADAGTRPSRLYRDAKGNRYLFKQANRVHIAAEVLAYRIRRFSSRPAVPSVQRRLPLVDGSEVEGLLQPLIANHGTTLPLDVTTWSPVQCEAMLREHPWEWLLANLDTHTEQYILVGPTAYPLNIDWDHSLVDLGLTELTRFNRRSAAIHPVRNLLYDAYVNRDLCLSLYGMRKEAARAHVLDDRLCAAELDRYCETLSLNSKAASAIHSQFFARKDTILRDFDRLIASLRLERVDRRTHRFTVARRFRRLTTVARDTWQRFAVHVLHDRVLRRGFRVYRRYLTEMVRHNS